MKRFLKRLRFAVKIYLIVKLMGNVPAWRGGVGYAWRTAKKTILRSEERV